MSPTESLMREWLSSGDPDRVRHAEAVIAAGFGEPTLPGLFRQAVNYIASTAVHVATGMEEASAEIVEARLAVCQGCENRIPRGEGPREQWRCADMDEKGCGCWLVAKAGRKTSECPRGKWPQR